MEIPKLVWQAQFKDGVIQQYDINGNENSFSLVKNRFNELERFILYNIDNHYIVDLKKGIILINNNPDINKYKDRKNCRLIFFRRHIVELGMNNLQELNHKIFYFLGVQYNDENNNNHKIILKIDENGSIVVGE